MGVPFYYIRFKISLVYNTQWRDLKNKNTFFIILMLTVHDLCCLSSGSVDHYTRVIFLHFLCNKEIEKLENWKKLAFFSPPFFFMQIFLFTSLWLSSATMKKEACKSLYHLTNLQTTNICYMFIAQDAKKDKDYN